MNCVKHIVVDGWFHCCRRLCMMTCLLFQQNSGYYWGFAAWFAYFINHPKFTAAPDNVVLPAAVAFGVSIMALEFGRQIITRSQELSALV